MAHRLKMCRHGIPKWVSFNQSATFNLFSNWKERKTNFKYMIYHAFFGIKKSSTLDCPILSFVLIISLCAFVFSPRVSCKHSFSAFVHHSLLAFFSPLVFIFRFFFSYSVRIKTPDGMFSAFYSFRTESLVCIISIKSFIVCI